jgi:hypothetical protein
MADERDIDPRLPSEYSGLALAVALALGCSCDCEDVDRRATERAIELAGEVRRRAAEHGLPRPHAYLGGHASRDSLPLENPCK